MSYDVIDIASQPTCPLSIAVPYSFHDYLQQYKLLWSDVAQRACVPSIVVWSIDHNLCVSSEHANKVRGALKTLTGVPFTGLIQAIG